MTLPKVRLCSEDDEEGISRLRRACHESGFFYLEDAMDESVCRRCADAALEFFKSPPELKESLSYELSPAFRGYMRIGVENTNGVIDQREQVELGPSEEISMREEIIAERLRGPNQWPPGGQLRASTEAWLDACRQVSKKLVRLMALALGLPPHGLDDVLGPRPHFQAKLAYYPAPSGSVGAHTDSGFLTLLWQDAAGLEVLSATDGTWTKIEPLERCLVCNIGEMLQLATGGYFLATPHRVRSTNTSRLSLPYFWNPSLDVVVENVEVRAPWSSSRIPLSEDDSTSIRSKDENRLMRAYGHNAFKSLARSHPKVFARHHPDLRILPDGTILKAN